MILNEKDREAFSPGDYLPEIGCLKDNREVPGDTSGAICGAAHHAPCSRVVSLICVTGDQLAPSNAR
jgi:hypothetical protein